MKVQAGLSNPVEGSKNHQVLALAFPYLRLGNLALGASPHQWEEVPAHNALAQEGSQTSEVYGRGKVGVQDQHPVCLNPP